MIKIISFIVNFMDYFKNRCRTRSSAAYIKYLRSIGVKIGEHTIIYEPQSATIDTTRPSLIEIGDFVKITKGVTILTHGYEWSVLRKKYGDIIASAGKVIVGNNVFIGMNTTIVKSTTIGNNVIIGANSLVSKNIPDDVVAAGIPAKPIMTLDEYLVKRKNEYAFEAKEFVQSFHEVYGRLPNVNEVIDFSPLFLKRNIEEINRYPEIKTILTDDGGLSEDVCITAFLESEPKFDGFDDFLEWCIKDLAT